MYLKSSKSTHRPCGRQILSGSLNFGVCDMDHSCDGTVTWQRLLTPIQNLKPGHITLDK